MTCFVLRNQNYIPIAYPGATLTGNCFINTIGEITGQYLDGQDNVHSFLLRDGQYLSVDLPNVAETDVAGITERQELYGTYLDANGIEHGYSGIPESPKTSSSE